MTLEQVNFDLFPYINRYSWMQREYVRLVSKNAQLVNMQQQQVADRPRKAVGQKARGAK